MAADPLDEAKTKVADAVDRLADELEKLSLQIHANPELCFKEEKASAWLTGFLEKQGARIERGVGGLPTAFRATVEGTGPGPTVAIMAEYDALPNIGHACGHNVIATAGTGAGAAIAAALGKVPFAGRVQVIGTPAEEGGAGKVKLMEEGVFKGVDAAMMIHGRCGTQVWRPSLGIVKVKCDFFGKASHASSWPWRGVNALNAMIQLFVSLDQMRQQIKPDARVHGIITKGGDQANIIPEHTASEFYLRAPSKDYCQELLRRFEGCAQGAATATGCTVKVTADPIIHDPLKPNFAMATLFGQNLERIDFPVDPDDGEAGYGSTDCGNVSQAIPTIHPYNPYIRISPDGIPGHSREVAAGSRRDDRRRQGPRADGARPAGQTGRSPESEGRVREERLDSGTADRFEDLARLAKMVQDVEPEDDRVGLPVELLDPVQRRLATVRFLHVDDHDYRRARLGETVRRRSEGRDDLRLEPLELGQKLGPRTRRRITRLKPGRDGLSRWTPPREQIAELLEARPMGLDEVVHHLLDGPFAGEGPRMSL